MVKWLLHVRIDQPKFLIALGVCVVLIVIVLAVVRPTRLLLRRMLIGTLAGGVVGWTVTWLLSDVWVVFGVNLSVWTKVWGTLLFVGLGLAIANLWRSPWWRKIVAIVAIPAFVVMAAAGINVDFGQYQNLAEVIGRAPYASVSPAQFIARQGVMDPLLGVHWRAPKGMPAHGTVVAVNIPAPISGFKARNAYLYRPPAALVAHPPVLPVLFMFSGQPGEPLDVIDAGGLPAELDAYAAAHRGLAPIVVVPDQLGDYLNNPMCVDSPLGNSATYLTVDVPNWVRSHLRVSNSARYWAVGGFSQGGTCAIQFGAGRPDLFRSIIDLGGEMEPTIGPSTVSAAFGGSEQQYDAAKPINIMAAHGPYADTWALFGAGSDDPDFGVASHQMAAAAQNAGMNTTYISAPGFGHTWRAVRALMGSALPLLGDRLGLGGV